LHDRDQRRLDEHDREAVERDERAVDRPRVAVVDDLQCDRRRSASQPPTSDDATPPAP
jgi:hypothetical protein